MIATAYEDPVPEGVEFLEGDICELPGAVRGEFGGAICLGNTLPHIRRIESLDRMFAGLRERLLENAPLLIQLLNYDRIFVRQLRHLPLNFRADGDEEIVFLRLMDLGADGEVLFYPSTLRLVPGADPPLEVKASKQVRLKGWRAAEVESSLGRAGFADLRPLGDFAGRDFDPLESTDLILVAR